MRAMREWEPIIRVQIYPGSGIRDLACAYESARDLLYLSDMNATTNRSKT